MLTILLLGVAGAAFYLQDRTPAEWIPAAVMVPRTAHATIQWDFREVTREELTGDPRAHRGFMLARAHCARCHLLPSPDQLPRETWPFVLSWMANYVGYPNDYGPLEPIVEDALAPTNRLISPEDFQTLADYYLLFAKPENALRKPEVDQLELTRFSAESPDFGLPPEGLITLVHFAESTGRYYLGDGRAKALRLHNLDGVLERTIGLDSEPVGIEIRPARLRLSLLGDFMIDRQQGKVIEFTNDPADTSSRTLVRDFPRLTQSLSWDLNEDGKEDLLLVGFGQGSAKGRVVIRWGTADGIGTEETILLDHAGGLNAVIRDFSEDGRPDILVLTSQGRQELWVFVNEGDGEFSPRLITKQFAGFGFNHLEIADFNRDGRMDLLLANGNNMEIKNAPVKPYHGLRLLENQGALQFTEKTFLPLPGALKAVARDFDGDGDPDLAAIAFYPDWTRATPETFAYFENQGGYRFTRSVLPTADWGHWLTMTSADVDHDGDEDILLGGGYIDNGVHTEYREQYQTMIANKPSVVLLRNTTREAPDPTRAAR